MCTRGDLVDELMLLTVFMSTVAAVIIGRR